MTDLNVTRTRQFGNPTPLAMGMFATTLLTLSLAMMGFRGVREQAVFVGNLCFAAGIGMFVSAQWEMILGNTFSYTVLTAFSLFYAGYGFILLPSLGIASAYANTSEYNNAMGFYILIWAVLNIFFVIASLPSNFVYILIFIMIELCLSVDSASYFALANGNESSYKALATTAGAFGFIAGLLGYYACLVYLFEDAFGYSLPMGDTARFFRREVPCIKEQEHHAHHNHNHNHQPLAVDHKIHPQS